MSTLAFISQAVGFLLVVVAAFGLLLLLSSLIRFNLIAHKIKASDPAQGNPEELFELRVVKELGGLRKMPPPFCVMSILPIPITANDPRPDSPEGVPPLPLWQAEVKQCLRANDYVIAMPDGSIQALAHLEPQSGELVARRLIDQISKTPLRLASGVRVRWGACVGLAHFPINGERSALLIKAARQAAETARQTGIASHHQELPPAATEAPDAKPAPMPPDVSHKILDEVTGVLRTERLGTAMQKFVALRRKEELGVSVAYLAVEDVPVYQERYGHDAANHILKTVADLLSKHSRETDLLARAGDADFIVGMDCAPDKALIGAQRLVNTIKKVTIRHGRMSLRVNISAGVAGYPDHTGNAKVMFEAAEQAMLKARFKGRSIAVLYEPETKPESSPSASSATEF